MATTPDARAVLAICVCLCLPSLAAGLEGGSAEFRFPKLDRVYAGFVEELLPIQMGLLEVQLRSPEHELTLEEHRAGLEALGNGEYAVRLYLRFHGRGLLDADLKIGLVEGKFEDELTLPRQALEMAGRVSVLGGVEGWTITLLEGPEHVEVRIQSRMAGRMVPLCRQMALVLVRFDCGALEESLSRVQVPLPRPGEAFFLAREELTDEEAAALDRYLEANE